MIKKQGITVTVMVVTIVILAILAGTITVSMYSTINYSRLSTWANEIMYIQDIVSEKLAEVSMTEFTTDIIDMNTAKLSNQDVVEQFFGETIESASVIQLYKLDLAKLGVTNLNYGKQKTELDIYAISEQTGKVYYVQGIEIDNKIYYTLTETLKNRFDLSNKTSNLTSIVFAPNILGYTSEPISVTVKVPSGFSNINITTSNDEIAIGSQTLKENTYEYIVNTNNVIGNYTVTVSYNDGVQDLVSKYEVKGYDATKPVIQDLSRANFVYKESESKETFYVVGLTATDESKIKIFKYEIGNILEANAKEYFKNKGKTIVDGKINLDGTSTTYTLYAEDMAGNYSVYVFDRTNFVSTSGWVKQGFTVTNGKQTLQIGDMIEYDETLGGTRTVPKNLKWKVLGADEEGNLLIVATANIKTIRIGYETTMTTAEEKLQEAMNDWLTYEQQLDGICEPYSYGYGAIGKARSINVDDVNKITGYSPIGNAQGKMTEYGNEVTYSWEGAKIKAVGTNGVTKTTTTDKTQFIYYNKENNTYTKILKGEDVIPIGTLKHTCYNYDATTLTTISQTENEKAYNTLFGMNVYYLLASRWIYTGESFAGYGIFSVGPTAVGHSFMFYESGGSPLGWDNNVRPVVTLSKQIVFSGDSTNGWTY